MSEENIIEVRNATVRFNKSTENYSGLKDYVIKMIKGQLMFQEFFALKNKSHYSPTLKCWFKFFPD